MTATRNPHTPTSSPQPSGGRRRRAGLFRGLAAAVVLVVGLAAVGIWWFLRDDSPDAVSLDTATAQLDGSSSGSGSSTTASSASGAGAAPGGTTAGSSAPADSSTPAASSTASAIEGDWSVDTSIGEFSFEDSTGSFVGFRVEEELASIGSTTAVGRTPDVSGTLTVEGTTVTAVTIEADMSTIVTNDSRRDDRARSALETSQYPTASFVLTQPIELGDAAASGEAVSVTATGELTIHGVTKTVQIPLQAQLSGDTVVVVGSIDVVFADYGVVVPTAPIVVSASDTGPIELQLFFSRS